MQITAQDKKHIANISIICIVIREFYYWKMSSYIILFVIYKSLEISLYYVILLFYLVFILKMKDY